MSQSELETVPCPRCFEEYEKAEAPAEIVCDHCGAAFMREWEQVKIDTPQRGLLGRFLEWFWNLR